MFFQLQALFFIIIIISLTVYEGDIKTVRKYLIMCSFINYTFSNVFYVCTVLIWRHCFIDFSGVFLIFWITHFSVLCFTVKENVHKHKKKSYIVFLL